MEEDTYQNEENRKIDNKLKSMKEEKRIKNDNRDISKNYQNRR